MSGQAAAAGKGAAAPALLKLSGVAKSFGGAAAVHPVDLEIEAGSFTAILGPSGCGKSTLLRMIGGFTLPSSGTILIDGADVTRQPPQKRPTNMVFQSHGLFPHMTVAENIGFGLSIAARPRDEITRRVAEALALVRLEGFADRPVDRLSGGQQQRVALARALVMRPKILLLDEPLSALDLKLRQAMQEELRRIHRETGGTFIFVTHDQGEAFALADRLIVMNAGRIEQLGRPYDVYRAPKNLFVARFVGDANVLEGTRREGQVVLQAGPTFRRIGPERRAIFVLRPEDIRIGKNGEAAGPGRMSLPATVADVVQLGGSAKVTAGLATGQAIIVAVADAQAALALAPGASVTLSWAESALVGVDA